MLTLLPPDVPSRTWVWPRALAILPPTSCVQYCKLPIHSSYQISSSVARFLGFNSSILPIICLDSLGRSLKRRYGPLICGPPDPWTVDGAGLLGVPSISGTAAAAAALRFWWLLDVGNGGEDGVVFWGRSGGEEKSLKELSDCRGAFQGNRRSVMQQKMMARDQTSAGCGSYFISPHTSGAR